MRRSLQNGSYGSYYLLGPALVVAELKPQALRKSGTMLVTIFVLFCFVWLVTLGMPVVAPGTAADTFRRVVEAPLSPPSSPVVERGALSTEVPPHLKTR